MKRVETSGKYLSSLPYSGMKHQATSLPMARKRTSNEQECPSRFSSAREEAAASDAAMPCTRSGNISDCRCEHGRHEMARFDARARGLSGHDQGNVLPYTIAIRFHGRETAPPCT